MKNITLMLLALMMISCSKKNEEISPDSIYNVQTNWEKQDGENITFSDLKGKVLVTAMIFTSCKTACPKLTAEMRTIAQKVGKVDPKDIQYVLISIDPENDTPKVMKRYLYVNRFDEKEWTFIRGNEEDTRELANIMAVKYKQISPIEFSHSNIITVYSKKGTLAFQKEGLDSNYEAIVNEIKKQIQL
ncbi:protein SCO1/2 [Chryseobacterium sediminis]|uniref:Protein SCO1/2 n=1 Tax=Chryseobacterium sediminis TaxID=1679494 RepID=A0ABR6PZL4_9FLAO|nr:SCO family protein [Chryseobacterium sediminis]MBB6329689.1 protein SCO1/2 [Chryseobacterium sediminis]